MTSPLPESVRAFVAIQLPEDIRRRLAELQRELREMYRGDAVKWTKPEQIHLTLKFFGSVKSDSLGELESALRKAAAGGGSFSLRAAGVGGFPNLNRPRVLWVGVEGELERLKSLQQRIENDTVAWAAPEEREFNPHLTIARIKDGRGISRLIEKLKSLAEEKFGKWRPDAIHLMRSETMPDGARHSCLVSIALEN